MKTAARPSLGNSASMDSTLEFLKELVDAHGVPGFEDDVARVISPTPFRCFCITRATGSGASSARSPATARARRSCSRVTSTRWASSCAR